MPELIEHYFNLPLADQAELLNNLAPVLGRRAEILEKDIWLCQILNILFKLPNRKPMAFKGGTSLSKVYQAIERFSEDIDITIDYKSLVPNIPDFKGLSNSQSKKLSEALKAALMEHITKELIPSLQDVITQELPGYRTVVEVSDDAEKVWLYYPSAVENIDTYLQPNILIEFGGRNTTLPQNTMSIMPDVALYAQQLSFPRAQVAVLSPIRTFWEKATLIHVECNRPKLRSSAERLSRHWYDLTCLADHEIGREALGDSGLLSDVLRIKETFYHSSFSNYELCQAGKLPLVPDTALLKHLRQDYQAMLDAHMFYGETLSFDYIIKRLTALEQEINQQLQLPLYKYV